MKQSLGGYTSPIKAGAAAFVFLYKDGFFTEFCTPDRTRPAERNWCKSVFVNGLEGFAPLLHTVFVCVIEAIISPEG